MSPSCPPETLDVALTGPPEALDVALTEPLEALDVAPTGPPEALDVALTGRLDVLDVLGVEIGEPGELGLIEVHHEQLVRGREVGLLRGELFVEVVDILAMLLWVTMAVHRCHSSVSREHHTGVILL